MRTKLISLIILAASCSSNDSAEWDKLTAKYFEYDKLGLYDSARMVAEQSLNFALDDYKVAQTYNNIAEMYRELGQFKKAVSAYEKSLTIADTNKFVSIQISSSTNFGLLYFDSKRYELAKPHFHQAISLLQELNLSSDSRMITPLSALGQIALHESNLNSARSIFEKTINIVDKNYKDNDVRYANIYENLAMLYLHKEKYDSTYYYLSQSQIVAEQYYNQNHPKLSGMYGLWGTYFHIVSNYDSALYYYEKSLDIKPQSTNSISQRKYQTFKNMGRLYIDIGDSIKGLELRKRAEEIKNLNL